MRRSLNTGSSSTFDESNTSSNNTLNKSSSIINSSSTDKISRISPSVSHSTFATLSDSGLSSVNSTQLFIADLRECFRQQSENLSCLSETEKARYDLKEAEYISLENKANYVAKLR